MPGDTYAIQGRRMLAGNGEALIRVRWKDSEGKWTAENEDRFITTGGRGRNGQNFSRQ